MFIVWLIGNREVEEVRRLLPELTSQISGAAIFFYGSLEEAESGSRDSSPDLVIVFQHQPYEYSSSQADRLLGSHPLARVIVGVGPWCASAGRTNKIWPDPLTVPFVSLNHRLQRVINSLNKDDTAYPLTTGTDEFVLNSQASEKFAALYQAIVISRDLVLARALTELIQDCGGQALRLSNIRSANIIFYDLDPIGQRSREGLKNCRAHNRNARMVAVTAVSDRVASALPEESEIDFVLPKPFSVAHLQSLTRLVTGTSKLSNTKQRAA